MTKSETSQAARPSNNTALTSITLSQLRKKEQLWYKIHVLLYDLRNIKTDHASEMRTLSTTDELYISSPYFSEAEAAQTKSALIIDAENIGDKPSTVEEFIKTQLETFFEKRRASGDARPCGPHDLAPIYEKAFGIEHTVLQDEKLLARLRRSGLGESIEGSKNAIAAGKKKKRKGK
jgi:hypothetical protein